MWTAVQGPGRSWPAKFAGMGGTPAGKGLIADTMFVLWAETATETFWLNLRPPTIQAGNVTEQDPMGPFRGKPFPSDLFSSSLEHPDNPT